MAVSYVPPPCSAPAPNDAPGRDFWLNPYRDAPGEEDQLGADPLPIAFIDPMLPNLSQQQLAAQIYTQLVNAGTLPSTARTLADVRAALMCSG